MNIYSIIEKPEPQYELITDGEGKVWYRAYGEAAHWTMDEIKDWAKRHNYEFVGEYNE